MVGSLDHLAAELHAWSVRLEGSLGYLANPPPERGQRWCNMADWPIGFCTWPGIDQVIEAQFTLCQGVRPSVCTLETAP